VNVQLDCEGRAMHDRPVPAEFNEGMMSAVAEVMDGTENFDLPSVLQRMQKEEGNFNYPDAGIDSLDMLDITFSANKGMGVRIDIDAAVKAVNDGKARSLTTELLLDHTRFGDY
jgi:hypothetical protein